MSSEKTANTGPCLSVGHKDEEDPDMDITSDGGLIPGQHD